MTIQPSDFARRTFPLLQSSGDKVDRPSLLVEPSRPWVQKRPAFTVNQSGTSVPEWLRTDQPFPRHSTVFVDLNDILLFGSNHLMALDGSWQCESASFSQQFINFYNTPTFSHFYPGKKPVVTGDCHTNQHVDLTNLEAEDIEYLHEDVFLVTPHEPDNWGRWISTVIPKLCFYLNNSLTSKVLIRNAKSWQKSVLATLGIPNHRIVAHDPGRTYLCKRLTTLKYSATDLTPTDGELKTFSRLRSRAQAEASINTPLRIFISRLAWSARNPHYRTLQNEIELMKALESLGFVTVEPETMSFLQQVCLFGSAEQIVGLGGSGMFNVVFARDTTKIVTVEASFQFLREHSRMISAVTQDYGVVVGEQEIDHTRNGHATWKVNVDEVVAAVEPFLCRGSRQWSSVD